METLTELLRGRKTPSLQPINEADPVTDLSLYLTPIQLKSLKIPDEYSSHFSADLISRDKRSYALLYNDGRCYSGIPQFGLYSKDKAAHGEDSSRVEEIILREASTVLGDLAGRKLGEKYVSEDGYRINRTIKLSQRLTNLQIAEFIERLESQFLSVNLIFFSFSNVPKRVYDNSGLQAQTHFRFLQ